MAKVTGALLSLGGSGAVAKTVVYSKWRGVPYARQFVKPSNPNTADQQQTRSVFTYMSNLWKLAATAAQLPWASNAVGRAYTGRNKFIGDNVRLLRPGTDMSDFVASPGSNGGLVAASISAANVSGTVTTTLVAPDLPSGWTIQSATAWLVHNSDPHTATVFQSYVGTDNTTPYAPAVSGVAVGSYIVSGWFVFVKPDGSLAYGPSISTTVTV